jgi:hypothetical protein
VIFEKCAKLHSPRRLVQFWHIFQISLVVLIINCTPSRVITYTYTYAAGTDRSCLDQNIQYIVIYYIVESEILKNTQ